MELEFTKALQELNDRKAPVTDDIPVELLRKSGEWKTDYINSYV